MKVLTEAGSPIVDQNTMEKAVENKEKYRLVDMLDDLFKSNKAQMQRRNRESLMVEDEVEDALAEIQAEVDAGTLTDPQEIEARKAQAQADIVADYPYEQVGNLLVLGEPGGGKTSIIEQWAADNGIGLVVKTGSDIDENSTKGTPFARKVTDPNDPTKEVDVCAQLPSEFFKDLDDKSHKYNVLFVDEINRSYVETEGALLTLVQDRTIQDRNYTLGRHKFDRYLFTIAAMNPPSFDSEHGKSGKKGSANAEARVLSNALNTRFKVFYWNSDPEETKAFMDRQIDKMMSKDQKFLDKMEASAKFAGKATDTDLYGDIEDVKSQMEMNKMRKKIVDTLLSNGNFRFADKDEIADSSKGDPHKIHVLNARTLTTALFHNDGTLGLDPSGEQNYPPNSFMGSFKASCSQDPAVLRKVEYMLSDLDTSKDTDVNNRANKVKDNLMDRYNRWRDTFGAQYGLA